METLRFLKIKLNIEIKQNKSVSVAIRKLISDRSCYIDMIWLDLTYGTYFCGKTDIIIIILENQSRLQFAVVSVHQKLSSF